jgi:prolipoprotein diacylglyceryltransferase/protein-S-isoprenylcysteine O-methyltransferase Ste14
MALRPIAPRVAYAALFCIVLPAGLILWTRATRDMVTLPAYGSGALGMALAAAGGLLFAAGVAALWRKGGGLPMNAFPPPRLVTAGIYGAVPHPIYTGFCLAGFGLAMVARSPSGLWLTMPAVALGCAALVWGYEIPDLERRFGRETLKRLRRLPAPTAERPTVFDALRFYGLVLAPWVAIYEIGATLGVPSLAIQTTFAWEEKLPVWTWTEPLYASIYAAAVLVPVLAATRRHLRVLTTRLWVSMAIIYPLYFCIPTFAPWRPFTGGGFPGRMLLVERAIDVPAQALPSYHVVWAVLAAEAMAASRRRKWPFRLWAALVGVSCVTTGEHSLADVAAGVAFALLLMRAERVWQWLLRLSERVANSWREWRVGPVRVINHGFYAGAATFVCLTIVGWLVGSRHLPMVVVTGCAGLAGAGLWAQWVEGSPRLLRPFGFYGGLFAVMAASALGRWFGADPWLLMAAYCVAGPWLQAIGRLRCLVQGCCHGRPAEPEFGIRYLHPRSRVCRLAGWSGVPLHAAPLYSILWNMVIALVVTRLWVVSAPLTLIGGVYLILTGVGRFCEEAYRGEPQTRNCCGLRLYQWIAIGTVVAGAAITALPGAAAPHWAPGVPAVAIAAVLGAVSTVALGVDFPDSGRRFARLT